MGQDGKAKIGYWQSRTLLQKSKEKSAPGIDGIDYNLIKHFKERSTNYLLTLYNEILQSQTFPAEWTNYLIFFIPKSDSTKFRPISLAPCLLKILETMINFRLNWWLERKQLLAKSQFRFRRQKSCTDNLSVFCSEIYNGFLQNKPLIGAFLDVKGAYDNVLADVLINRLQKIKIPANLLSFIYNLTAEWKLNFRTNSEIITRLTFRGLPQGSALSPLLYNLYTAELENFVTNDCRILQFPDDIAVYCNACTLEEGLIAVERTVANLGGHLTDSGLELEPSKCQLIIFNRNKILYINQSNISINGNTIKSSKKKILWSDHSR